MKPSTSNEFFSKFRNSILNRKEEVTPNKELSEPSTPVTLEETKDFFIKLIEENPKLVWKLVDSQVVMEEEPEVPEPVVPVAPLSSPIEGEASGEPVKVEEPTTLQVAMEEEAPLSIVEEFKQANSPPTLILRKKKTPEESVSASIAIGVPSETQQPTVENFSEEELPSFNRVLGSTQQMKDLLHQVEKIIGETLQIMDLTEKKILSIKRDNDEFFQSVSLQMKKTINC